MELNNFYINFKTTIQTNEIFHSLQNHIKNNYGGDFALQNLNNFLIEHTNLRKKLIYDNISNVIYSNEKHALEFEQNIFSYLKNCLYLEKKFSEKPFNFPFIWNDSFNNKSLKINNFKYELVSQFFNLFIIEYILGIKLLLKESDEDKKASLVKLRYALWCIQQIKQHISSLSSELFPVPTEFQFIFLTIFENFLIGCYYKI